MNKYLITGGSGFIGSYFNEMLETTIINYDIREPIRPNENVFEQGDIRDKERLSSVVKEHGINKIIHLAAAHHDFGITRDEYFDVNENGLKVICEVASENDINEIVFYSSVAIYGESSEPSDESKMPNPSNAYGESKLAGEEVLKRWVAQNQDRKGLIIRPVLVYGAHNTANMYNLIRQIDSGVYANIGNGRNIKSVCYVENIVAATIWAMTRWTPGVTIYNYSDHEQLSSGETVEIIRTVLGKKKPIRVPFWFGILASLPFDLIIKITGKNLPVSSARVRKMNTSTQHSGDKIFNDGFKPEWKNSHGLRIMVDWYKKQKTTF